ncbi:MAG: hypothetical protein M1829_006836 [Trizodia sp. TS-e1964]|nr:MAG: hypothetical protein M1829_006836 [Trizodia sp. TS-e1964]
MDQHDPSISTQINNHLASTFFLVPSKQWLDALLASKKATTPLPSILNTVQYRLLNSDFKTTLSPISPINGVFPTDIHDSGLAERTLEGAIAVQILAIEDISKSRWEQIEALEAIQRGEGTKGREVIRVVRPDDDGQEADGPVASGGPHKLLVQDYKGQTVYALELRAVEGLGVGMKIGAKLILRNIKVQRGVLLLHPSNTIHLGGQIGALHQAWKANRMKELVKFIEKPGG